MNNAFSSGLKNAFAIAGMKNFLKNICENGRKWIPPISIRSIWFPLISVTVSASRKELSSKVRRFPIKKKSFSNSSNKGLIKKYVSTRRKKSLWFALARKSVSTTQNESFVEKYVSTIQKNCFFLQKKSEMVSTGFH